MEEDHHALTRYSKENKKLFEKIGFDVDDDFNLIKDFLKSTVSCAVGRNGIQKESLHISAKRPSS